MRLTLLPVLVLICATSMRAQTLRIVAPADGAAIEFGTEVELAWTGLPADERVRIDITRDEGITWETIAKHASGGRFVWRATGAPARSVRARIIRTVPDSATRRLPHGAAVSSVSFSADGDAIVTADEDGVVRLWKSSGELVHSWTIGFLRFPPYVSAPTARISPDGRMVAVSYGYGRDTLPSTSIFDAATGALLHRSRDVDGPLAFSPDSRLLAIRDRIIHLGTFEVDPDYRSMTWDVGSIEFTNDGRRTLISECGASVVALHELDDDFLGERYGPDDWLWGVPSATLTGDDRFIVGIDNRTQVFVIDRASGKTIWQRWLVDTSAATAPDTYACRPLQARVDQDAGVVAATGPDAMVTLLDLDDGAILRRLAGHGGAVLTVDIAPDGRTLASGSADSTVHVVHFSNGPDTTVASQSWQILEPRLSLIGDSLIEGAVFPHASSVARALVVRNDGPGAADVSTIQLIGGTGFGLYDVPPTPLLLGPGDTVGFRLAYTPATLEPQQATILVGTNGAPLRRTFTATATARPLVFGPDFPTLYSSVDIDMGYVRPGGVRDSLVVGVVENVGAEPLTIRVRLEQVDDTSAFSLVEGEGDLLLEPGVRANVLVRFAPVTKRYHQGAIVRFEYDGPGEVLHAWLRGGSNDDPIPASIGVVTSPVRLLVDGEPVGLLPAFHGRSRLVVVDGLGRVVRSEVVDGERRVSIDGLVAGRYLVIAIAGAERTVVPVIVRR